MGLGPDRLKEDSGLVGVAHDDKDNVGIIRIGFRRAMRVNDALLGENSSKVAKKYQKGGLTSQNGAKGRGLGEVESLNRAIEQC